MIAGDIADIPERADLSSLRVHAPTAVVFVCGGPTDVKATTPPSLRDAFMRVYSKTVLNDYEVRLAEAMEFRFPTGEYKELLQFESDIAQISELILLFSESAGSLAELGAFVMDDEIAPRMMVVVSQDHYRRESFIKLGPIYSMSHRHGEESVCVLPMQAINVESLEKLDGLDLDIFCGLMNGALTRRLGVRHEPRTFNPAKNGHVTKLITGLIQHYGALTDDEIEVLLYCMNVPRHQDDIRKHIMCAELFGWVASEKVGVRTFRAATADRAALHFEFLAGQPKLNRSRWRADILEHWRRVEPDRFATIGSAAARTVQ